MLPDYMRPIPGDGTSIFEFTVAPSLHLCTFPGLNSSCFIRGVSFSPLCSHNCKTLSKKDTASLS